MNLLSLKERLQLRRAFTYGIRKTLPVFFGYLFLGIAFGLLLQNAGYGWPWAVLCSVLVYAGSMQFVLVSFLSGGTNLFMIALMTLLINSRHIFYGLSFLERFKKMGKAAPYMIFSLTDETYSLLCSEKVPPDLNENQVFFLISLLDQSYWVFGSILGAVLGQLITFDSTGVDFAMTALFVVIFLNQWKEYPSHLPAVTGLASSALFLILLGPDRFILPSLAVTTAVLALFRRFIEKEPDVAAKPESDRKAGESS